MVIKKILTPKDTPVSENAEIRDFASATLHDESHLFPAVPDSCELTVACQPSDFCASKIAHAIEDCDAHLLNLNVTSRPLPDGETTVLIRAALRNPESAVRALERYGYNVVAVHTPAPADFDTFNERIDELLTHLNL